MAHLKAADQDPAGDRLFAGPFACTASHLSWIRRLRRQSCPLDATWDRRTKPGHVASVCRALLNKSTSSSEAAIRILQSDLEVDPRWQPFAEDLRQRFDLPSVRNCCQTATQTQAFLESAGFPSGELGLQWRDDIRDVRIRLLNPNTRTQAWHEAKVYDALHPVLELLGRVDSREAEVLLQGVEQLRSSLLQTDSDELLDTSGVDRLAVVVEQFVNRTEMDPDQGGRLFRRLFPELRIQIRSADREILSRLPEILGGREVLLDPGRLAVYERFRTRSNLLGYAQSLEQWYTRWCEIFPEDRERLETVLRTVLASAIDAVLGDDAVQWIELFLDRSEVLYPKPLELKLSGVPWLSQVHRDLKAQLKSRP